MFDNLKDWIARHPEGVVGFFIGLIAGGTLASLGVYVAGLVK